MPEDEIRESPGRQGLIGTLPEAVNDTPAPPDDPALSGPTEPTPEEIDDFDEWLELGLANEKRKSRYDAQIEEQRTTARYQALQELVPQLETPIRERTDAFNKVTPLLANLSSAWNGLKGSLQQIIDDEELTSAEKERRSNRLLSNFDPAGIKLFAEALQLHGQQQIEDRAREMIKEQGQQLSTTSWHNGLRWTLQNGLQMVGRGQAWAKYAERLDSEPDKVTLILEEAFKDVYESGRRVGVREAKATLGEQQKVAARNGAGPDSAGGVPATITSPEDLDQISTSDWIKIPKDRREQMLEQARRSAR